MEVSNTELEGRKTGTSFRPTSPISLHTEQDALKSSHLNHHLIASTRIRPWSHTRRDLYTLRRASTRSPAAAHSVLDRLLLTFPALGHPSSSWILLTAPVARIAV